ncbi:MAG: Atrophin-1 multi-domain protein [Burkholderiales bacterium PBB1]|nr:MAG: Atrophin-1 multi-domain protein [Burkholderiales bacterium PBB1]
MILASACAFLPAVSVAAEAFGTPLRPFSAQSPWNARPVAPVFGDFEIPRSAYYPTLAEGKWSTGVFIASAGDKSVTVLGPLDKPGVWDPDSEVTHESIVIPRWPADVVPAEGTDGHADIVDPITGIIHSLFKLKRVDGQWRALQYAWTRLDGRGWGEPGHYFQGARASAVPTMGGLIRTHEVNDGDSVYRHALAMSLTFNGLSPSPAYVFPATSADGGAEKTNSGQIPEGALMMLPPEYDTASIKEPKLRKVAETLKLFGAYVVDRNVGTPFVIYVENGTQLNVHGGKWNSEVARELDRMRSGLRQVVAVNGWIDGNGRALTQLDQQLNLLSMRGPWRLVKGDGPLGDFQTWQQAVVFPPGGSVTHQINTSGRTLHTIAWARPQPGDRYLLTARAEGGGSLRLQLYDAGGQSLLYDSGELADGQSAEFAWPKGQRAVAVTVRGGGRATACVVGGSLRPLVMPAPAMPHRPDR